VGGSAFAAALEPCDACEVLPVLEPWEPPWAVPGPGSASDLGSEFLLHLPQVVSTQAFLSELLDCAVGGADVNANAGELAVAVAGVVDAGTGHLEGTAGTEKGLVSNKLFDASGGGASLHTAKSKPMRLSLALVRGAALFWLVRLSPPKSAVQLEAVDPRAAGTAAVFCIGGGAADAEEEEEPVKSRSRRG